jgi:hypothetical protein
MFRTRSHIVALVLMVGAAGATVPQAPREAWPDLGRHRSEPPAGTREFPPDLGPFAPLRQYAQVVRFLADWQQLAPNHPHWGGMIEAEAGPLGDVIQTDNTLEAIWVWSRWRRWTGAADFDSNIAAAWTYSTNYPAWLEEGAANDHYYRAHNCAWGLGACLEYEAATGDTTRRAYGRTCAQYIVDHPLPLTNQGNSLNALVTGWCAGSLHEYAVAVDRADWRAAAVEQGLDLLDFVEVDPARWLAWDEWAMSGGTILWGLCRSVFREAPLHGQHWLQDHVFQTPDWADWHNVSGYDWDGSWNVAYANGLFAVHETVGDPVSGERARRITEGLLNLDTDDDGAIRADSQDPDTEDMSWVTCYLARFCLSRLVGDPPLRDLAPLRLAGLRDEDVVPADLPLELRVVVANHGLQDAVGATLALEADGQILWDSSSPAGAALDTVSFGDWTPASGRHRLRMWTVLPGDTNPANDTLAVDLVALAVPGSREPARDAASRIRVRERDGLLHVEGASSGAARVEVYNLLGQRLAHFPLALEPGVSQAVRWRERVPGLAEGLYLLRVEQGGAARVLRVHTFH